MTRLEVKRLVGPPGAQPRVEDVSLTVDSGQIAAVFGPERSGKRLLLRMLSGLEAHAAGDVILDESSVQHLPAHHRRIGAVFQDSPMFPGTVAANVVYGLERVRWPSADRERRVAEVLELVGMTGSERDSATGLPEAERWRVAIARAIAPAPPVLMIESPAHPVDEVLRPDFRAALRQLLKSINLTTLIATADLRDAISIADDLHVMDAGRILQSGPLSRVLAGPASIEVAEMVGYHTLIRGEVSGSWITEHGVGAVQFPAGFPLSGTARALAHPAAMLGVPDTSGLGIGVTGAVERIRAIGPTYLLDLRVGDRLIEVRWEWDPAPPPLGLAVSIAVTPGTLRFFNDVAPRTVEAADAGEDDGAPELRPRQGRWGRRPADPAPHTEPDPPAAAAPAGVTAGVAPAIDPAPAAEVAVPPLAAAPRPGAAEPSVPEWSAEWRASAAAEVEPPVEEAAVTWTPEPWPDLAEPDPVDASEATRQPWSAEPAEPPGLYWPESEVPAADQGPSAASVVPPEEPPVPSVPVDAAVDEPRAELDPPLMEPIEHETPASSVLAPWLSASRPPSPAPAPPPASEAAHDPGEGREPRPDSSRRHQGMPLD